MTLILDAGCSNRSIWVLKNLEQCIYLDKQKRLVLKLTVLGDLRQSPFKDQLFDLIYFDPPWISRRGNPPPYWGNPKVKPFYGLDITASGITKLLYQANKEFNRILKDTGLLFIKWNESERPFSVVIMIMSFFKLAMIKRILSGYPYHRSATVKTKRYKNPTYWATMIKIKGQKPK